MGHPDLRLGTAASLVELARGEGHACGYVKVETPGVGAHHGHARRHAWVQGARTRARTHTWKHSTAMHGWTDRQLYTEAGFAPTGPLGALTLPGCAPS